MTYVITHGCCSDSSCVPVCPVQCIRPRPGDPDFTTTEQLYIDPATCIDCGACMDVCPVNAIQTEWDLPEHLADDLQINALYFATNPITESEPADPIRRRLPADRPTLSVAIVGSGPAGCYAAAELSDIKGVNVSMFERLPTPFGLIRAGVAPDHADTKQIATRFNKVLARPNVHCFFNVDVPRDITIEELLTHHHAVIWAAGASSDRQLGIPGEDLSGCVSAREFVAWYNGHPDLADRGFTLAGERAVVIGNGNVALDVARTLTQPAKAYARTDIADHALAVLEASTLTEVVLTARRGPEFASYSTGELSALQHTDGVALCALPAEVPTQADQADRRAAIVAEAAARTATDDERAVILRFGLQPVSVNGTDTVESITFRHEDGTEETIDASMVIKAIGYRGSAVQGLPFDELTGTLSHTAGSVCDPKTGEPVVGVFCSGWIKRGPSGMIGTNKVDSAETVDSLLREFGAGRLPEPAQDLQQLTDLVRTRQPDMIDHQGWSRIDQRERRDGRPNKRPRRKLVAVSELVQASRPS